MFDLITTALGEYLLALLPETRRGRIALLIFMVCSVAFGLVVLIAVLAR